MDGLSSSTAGTSASLLSSLGRLRLESGDIPGASTYFQRSASHPESTLRSKNTDAAFLATAKGEWKKAIDHLGEVLKENPEDLVVRLLFLPKSVLTAIDK